MTPLGGRALHLPRVRGPELLFLLMLTIVTVIIGLQFSQSSARLRAETQEQAQRRGAQVGSATSEAVAILFKTVDVTSRELTESFASGNASDFNKAVDQAVARLPAGSVLQVAVINAEGYLRYSNLGMSEKVYLGDREHFKVHVGADSDQWFISKPVQGRVSKQWSIQFSRPIRQGDRFVGVLVMSVSPTYIQQTLQRIALDSDDSITVLRSSGEFLARNRSLEETLGKSVEMSRPFLLAGAPATGQYRARSSVDQVARLLYWHRLEGYPVIVLLGLSEQTAFGPVERSIAADKRKTIIGVCLLWFAALCIFVLARKMNVQIRKREAMEMLAMSDTLTGLKSRHAVMAHLERALTLPAKAGGALRVGVLYLDLDGFKAVNDRHGHAAGDEVLKTISSRLQACVRSQDMAARIGGDEFVVVVAPLQYHDELRSLRERVAKTLKSPITLSGGMTVSVGASIGCAISPDHGDSADDLLAHADREMYLSKVQEESSLCVLPF